MIRTLTSSDWHDPDKAATPVISGKGHVADHTAETTRTLFRSCTWPDEYHSDCCIHSG